MKRNLSFIAACIALLALFSPSVVAVVDELQDVLIQSGYSIFLDTRFETYVDNATDDYVIDDAAGNEMFAIEDVGSSSVVRFGSASVTTGLTIPDNLFITFGTSPDFKLGYDETTEDMLELRDPSDNDMFYWQDGGSVGNAGVTGTWAVGGTSAYTGLGTFSAGLKINDDQDIYYGTDSDIRVRYDEAGDDRLEWHDGTNLLAYLTDAGTAGNFGVTGTLGVTGLSTIAGLTASGRIAAGGAAADSDWVFRGAGSMLVYKGTAVDYTLSQTDVGCFNDSANSRFIQGQSTTHYGVLQWVYNATTGNAYYELITNQNQRIYIGKDSSGPTTIRGALTAATTITAGSGAHQITTAAGLIDDVKIDPGTNGQILVTTSGASAWANPKRAIILTASGSTPALTAGSSVPTQVETASNDINYWVTDFDASTDESCSWEIVLPDDYVTGSNFSFKVSWGTVDATTSGAAEVVWILAGLALADGEAFDAAFTATSSNVTDTNTGAGNLNVSPAGTITGTNFTAGDLVVFRLTRNADDGTDDLAADARLHQVKLEYSSNAV